MNIPSSIRALAIAGAVILNTSIAESADILFMGKGSDTHTEAYDVNFLKSYIAQPPGQRLGFTPVTPLYDIESTTAYVTQNSSIDPSTFEGFKAVVICSLPDIQAWTSNQTLAAKSYVENGGILILLDNALIELNGGTNLTATMKGLIPAAKVVTAAGTGLVVSNDTGRANGNNVTSHLVGRSDPWMRERSGLAVVTPGSMVKSLIYNSTKVENGYATVNTLRHQIGSGFVYFMGSQLVAYDQPEGIEHFAWMVDKALHDAPLTHDTSTTRERWVLAPGGAEQTFPTGKTLGWKSITSQKIVRTPESLDVETVIHESGVYKTVIVIPDTFAGISWDDPIPLAAKDLRKVLELTAGTRVGMNDATYSSAETNYLDQPTGIPITNRENVVFTSNATTNKYDVVYTPPGGTPKTLSSAILIGDHALAPFPLSIPASTLPLEGFRLKTHRNLLFVISQITNPANNMKLYGVEHGVIRLLEEGIKPTDPKRNPHFFWPGELGTSITVTSPLRIPPIDLQDSPALPNRKIRNVTLSNDEEVKISLKLIYSNGATAAPQTLIDQKYGQYLAKHNEAGLWFRRSGAGSTLNLETGHAYGDYYDDFELSHPEWFALQPNGTRVQDPVRPHLDKSQPGLIANIRNDTLAMFALDPTLYCVSVSPNDGGYNAFDMGSTSRLADPTNAPTAWQTYYIGGRKMRGQYPSLTTRMVAFYNQVANLLDAAGEPATKRLSGHAYQAYKAAPSAQVPINSRLLITFAGPQYLDEASRQKDLEAWDGWGRALYGPTPAQNADGRLILRPNAFWLGLGLPVVYTDKLKDDILFCAERGMLAADFDGGVHHWASQGINYYIVSKLLWDPSQNAASLTSTYCRNAFWYAMNDMVAFFSQLQDLSDALSELVGTISAATTDRPPDSETIFLGNAWQVFTSAEFTSLKAKLAAADTAVDNSSASSTLKVTLKKRIDFYRKSIDYGEKTIAIYKMANNTNFYNAAAIKSALIARNSMLKDWLEDSSNPDNYWAIGLMQSVYKEEWLHVKVDYKY